MLLLRLHVAMTFGVMTSVAESNFRHDETGPKQLVRSANKMFYVCALLMHYCGDKPLAVHSG